MVLSRFFLSVVIIGSTLLLSGCGLRETGGPQYRMPLEVWGVFDDSDSYDQLFAQYRALNPHIGDIRYRKFSEESYKRELLDALASGNGPDIFMINNTWTPTFQDKVIPAPESLINEKRFRESFPDVVVQDFFSEQDKKVYAVPLSVDSLGLYYNKDIFNAAGVTAPPRTWEEVLTLARKFNSIDQYGEITQSAIALGGAYNINRAADIVEAMMLQLGAPMNSGGGDVRLGEAGMKGLDYYMQFSRTNSPYYGWNAREHYSIDAFYEGTLAMMLNYSYRYPTIKQKNIKLNFAVAPLPQFGGTAPANVADYFGFVVSKNKSYEKMTSTDLSALPTDTESREKIRQYESWQLLEFLALPHGSTITLFNALSGNSKQFPLSIDPAEEYLKRTEKPAARLDLIEKQKNDPVLSPFASGNLIARGWRQRDPEGNEGAILSGIDEVQRGARGIEEAIRLIESRINTLERR